MARALILLAALLCACGADDDEPYVLFANGDRLIAEYYVVADVQLFIGFYDSERGERCAFTVVPTSPGFNAPGASYCLPGAAPPSGWYADAACTEELASGDSGARVYIEWPLDACLGQPNVYELGETVDAESSYSLDADGACVPFAAMGGPPPALRRRGPPIGLDAFVQAEHQIVPLSERMGALVVKAEDGASVAFAGFDRLRNESTHPYGHGYELVRNRWWPRQVAYSSEMGRKFADPACSKPIATKDTPDALCPIATIMEYVDGDCGYSIQHLAAGPPIDVSAVYGVDAQGSCTLQQAGSPGRAVELGAFLPADSFAELTMVNQGSGPVVLRLYGTPEGIGVLPASDFPFFDEQRQWPCDIALATDGTSRCLPGAFGVPAFSDPACTQRIVGFDIAMGGCEPSPRPTAIRVVAGSDPLDPDPRYAAFPVAEKIPQPASVYDSVNGSCEPHSVVPPAYEWHALGPEVTVDELPRVGKVLATPP